MLLRQTVCELHDWDRIRAFVRYNPTAVSVSIPHGMQLTTELDGRPHDLSLAGQAVLLQIGA